jgi:glycosyltransferase involved in cell wall biosynthesis
VTDTLLILHDSPDFGGHERMLLALLPGLIAARAFDRIAFAVPRANVRLAAALAPFAPDIAVVPWDNVKRRAEPYLRFFRLGYRRAVATLIATERPSTVLLVQGRVENLASALGVLPRDVHVVSYIPMAHSMTAMGRSGLIGDRVRRALYRRPDGYVVPADAVAGQLRAHGVTVPIEVAHNTVAPPPRTDRDQARRELGLPADRRLALVLGRLDPAQKGIDRLLAAIDRAGPARLDDWSFVIVGDGPGRAMVDAAAARLPAGTILPVAWTDRPNLHLSAADILVMPSRWEGLPLVMLEALAYDLPVLASPIDVFRDFLPPEQITDFDVDDLAAALARATDPDRRATLAAAARDRFASLTIERARAAFVRALLPEGRA